MYTIQDIQQHQRNALTTYFDYHKESVGQVRTLTKIEAVAYPLNHSSPTYFTVDKDNLLGPFNSSRVENSRAYFDGLKEVHFHYQFNNTHQSYLWNKGTASIFLQWIFYYTARIRRDGERERARAREREKSIRTILQWPAWGSAWVWA